MSINKSFIFIPYWVHQTLQRNKLKLADVLDFNKIRTLFSTNDLITLYALQEYAEYCTGAQLGGMNLYFKWSDTVTPENRAFLDTVTGQMSTDLSFRSELQSRLFHPDSKQQEYDQPFITYDITPEVGGVVLYPGFFTPEGKTQYRYSLVTAMLKLLYVYTPYNEGARSPLFNVYLELLSKKKIMI